ncbi:PAS domain-containing protein [Lacinutrix sp. MEBiC02404]
MNKSTLLLFFKKPLVLAFLFFIVLLFATQYIAYQEYIINKNEQQREINNQVNLIQEKLQSLVMYSYSATKSLEYIVERNGIPSDFDNIAAELLNRSKYFDVVELVDREGFITHVYPLKNNEVIGFNILTSPEASSGSLTTIKRKDFFIAGPVHLEQGGVGMVSRQPIFIDGEFSGFSAVVTKLSTFFNDLITANSNGHNFIYQLSRVNLETGEEDFFLESDISSFKEFAVPVEMSVGEWKLYVVPLQQKFNTAIWSSILGVLIAFFSSWSVWYFGGRSARLNELISSKLLVQEKQLKSIHQTTSEKIQKSESNLRKAQQIAKLGSWELDKERNKLSWSNEMYRIFEKNPKDFEVTYDAFLDAIHPDDMAMVMEIYADSVKSKNPYQIIYRLKLDNERIKYVNERCETFYDENQIAIKSFGTIQDVTSRIKTEEVLKNRELLYRSLTSNAPVAIFNTNEKGECTYVNEEWLKYTGMNFLEAMGLGWENALHPEDKERVLKEWQEAATTGAEFKGEFRFQDKNNKITSVAVKATKLLDTDDNMHGYIGIAVDITERIANEKELLIFKNNLEELVNLRTEELNDSKEALLNLLEDINLQSTELEKEKVKAQSADLMKSAFLATMSHELRTPMNSIIGFTGILLKELAGPLNQEQKKQLSMVKNSSAHLLSLINDILDISKIEAGKLKVSFYPFKYLTSLENTIDFLEPQASRKGLTVKTEISNFDITLISDERRVEQVLLNLLSNAIKFSEKGIIVVKVHIEDNVLVTQVIDQGIGITKKDAVKLFMPFIQIEGGLNRKHEGTGLGLAICKSLVEKLGGTIRVESELGKGSNFTFKIPLEYVDKI